MKTFLKTVFQFSHPRSNHILKCLAGKFGNQKVERKEVLFGGLRLVTSIPAGKGIVHECGEINFAGQLID